MEGLVALRWNNPPGWPTPPDGWLPPQGWAPPADWPQPPPDWQYYIEEVPPDPFFKSAARTESDPWAAPAKPAWAAPDPYVRPVGSYGPPMPAGVNPTYAAANTRPSISVNSALMWCSWAGLPVYLVLIFVFSTSPAPLIGGVITLLFANLDDRYLRRISGDHAKPPNGAWVLLFPPIYFYKRQRFTGQSQAAFWSWLIIFLVWFIFNVVDSVLFAYEYMQFMQQYP